MSDLVLSDTYSFPRPRKPSGYPLKRFRISGTLSETEKGLRGEGEGEGGYLEGEGEFRVRVRVSLAAMTGFDPATDLIR